jgi:hypothetical protein
MFDVEPVGGRGSGPGGVLLVLPVNHGRVASAKALFLVPVREGAGNGGDLEHGRGEGRADLGLVEPDMPWFCLDQPGTLPRRGRMFQLPTKSLGIAIHFAVELCMAVQGVPIGGVILVSFNV